MRALGLLLRASPWIGAAVLGAGIASAVWRPLERGLANGLAAGGLVLLVAGLFWNVSALRRAAGARATRYGAQAGLYTLAVLAILVLVNFVASRHSWRHDFTDTGVHSLAPQTLQILEGLQEPVTAKVFVSAADPGSAAEEVVLRDLLEELHHASPRFRFDVFDPAVRKAEALEAGITYVPSGVLYQADRKAKVDRLDEQGFVDALLQVTLTETRKVCFLQGHAEHDPESPEGAGASFLAESLRKERYEIQAVNLAREPSVPAECTVLVIAGPQAPLLDPEEKAVRLWIEAGGSTMLLEDPDVTTGLEDDLERYGVRIGNDLVVDMLSRLLGAGPTAPVVLRYDSHPITRDLALGQSTFFPVARSVESDPNAPYIPGLQVTSLGRTEANQSFAEMDAQAEIRDTGGVRFDPERDRPGPISLGVAVEVDRKQFPQTAPSAAGGENPRTRLVVFGDSDFLTNQFVRQAGNLDLALNSIAWLADRRELISIRPRTPRDHTVSVQDKQAAILKWLGVFLPPLIVLAGGFTLWWRRRRL